MISIFYIHSHITFYLFKSISKSLGLKSDEIGLVITRNYSNTTADFLNFNILDLSEEHNEFDEISSLNFRKRESLKRRVDFKMRDKFGHVNYIMYLPHVGHTLMQILITNKCCSGFHIMEEGANAYSKMLCSKKTSILKKLINFSLRFIGSRYYYLEPFDFNFLEKRNFKTLFYATNVEAFKGVNASKIVVQLYREECYEYYLENATVFVFEAAVEQGNLKLHTLDSSFETILINSKIRFIYLKFHPSQNEEVKNTIINKLNEFKVKFEIINNSLSFEQIVLNSKNIEVWGFASSLLYYSKLFGAEVNSFEELLLGDSLFITFRKLNDYNLNELLKC